MYVKNRTGDVEVWRPPGDRLKQLHQHDSKAGNNQQADMETLFSRLIKKQTTRLQVDKRIPPHMAKKFTQIMESYQRTAPALLAKSTQEAAQNWQTNPSRALDVVSRETLAQAGRYHNIHAVYNENFRSYLALVQQREEEDYLFVSENSADTCDACERYHGQLLTKQDLERGDSIPPLHPNCRCSLVALDRGSAGYYNGPNGEGMLWQLQRSLDMLGGAGIFILDPRFRQFGIHPGALTRLELSNEMLITGIDPKAQAMFRELTGLIEELEGNAKETMEQLGEDLGAAANKFLWSSIVLLESFLSHINARLENAWEIWEEHPILSILIAADAATGTLVSSIIGEFKRRTEEFVDDPGLLSLGNWLTLGLLDSVIGTLFPEEVLSPEHLADMLNVALTLAPFILARSRLGSSFSSADEAVRSVADDLARTPADDGLRGTAHGLTQRQIDEILWLDKGERPDPSTYLSRSYIDSHLAQFEGGVTKIISKPPNGRLGADAGTYVMPSSLADDLIRRAGGDIAKLEELLGLPSGSLGTQPVRVDISNPTGLRMPTGNEAGVNSLWCPGGYTSGGIMEAVINPVAAANYIVRGID